MSGLRSFSWLNNILLHIYATSSLSIHLLTKMLGYVHTLSIVNNAAINMQWRYCLKILFLYPLDIHPELGFLDHLVVLLLMFLRNLHTTFVVTIPIYIPNNSAQDFPFLYNLANTCYQLPFWCTDYPLMERWYYLWNQVYPTYFRHHLLNHSRKIAIELICTLPLYIYFICIDFSLNIIHWPFRG